MDREKARREAMKALGKLLPADESGKMEERAIKGYIELLETEAGVKTAKQEAREAISKLSAMNGARYPALESLIHRLTADRVNELVPPAGDALHQAYERAAKSYVFSVDACLTLPIPGCVWLITAGEGANSVHIHTSPTGHSKACQRLSTLPLTMLDAFWQTQPD